MDERMLPYAIISLSIAIVGVAIMLVGFIYNLNFKLIETGKYVACGGVALYAISEIIGFDGNDEKGGDL